MAARKCPECGASVKLENLERHFASVHPGRSMSADLSEQGRRAARARRTTGRGPEIRRSTMALALVFGLAAVLVGASAMYLPRLGPQEDVMALHVHPRIRITIDGVQQTVPANIGIAASLWNDHALDSYGMEGMSPLHTHDTSGTVHVESRVVRDYTVGEFFRVWGESFDTTQVLGHPAGAGHRVRMVVDGAETGPSNGLVLRDGMDVHIICDVG